VTRRRLLRAGGALFCAAGLALAGAASAIHAKAWLVQALLERAWAQRLDGAAAADARPWGWADTAPVARLQAPRLGVDRIVLAGASGRTLAFGPGHLDGTAAPGETGNSIVTGHRDTHFAFLRDLVPGDALRVQSPDGVWHDFRVSGTQVLDARTARFDPAAGRPALTLVTCFPFDAVAPGGPLRYAVFGEAVTPAARTAPPARHAANNGTGRPE
jgi:sortase A